MFAWTGVLMVLYLYFTTGTSNLAMAFPTPYAEQQQNDEAKSTAGSQSREESKEEGYESTGGPFSQENLQAMGQQIGQEMFQEIRQEIKTTTKEEATHAMHKVQDKVDRQTDKWVEDMQNKGAKESSNFASDDQAMREFQNILAVNSKRFMSDIVRSFLSPEDIRASLEQAPVTQHSTPADETLEPPNLPAKIVTPYTRPARSVDDEDSARADMEAKASSSPFPYIPSYPPTSPGSTSSSSNSNPLYGGMPGSGQGDATLIIGGFNILLVPMPGVNANNMGSMLQNSQQLSQFTPGNPFANNRAAV